MISDIGAVLFLLNYHWYFPLYKIGSYSLLTRRECCILKKTPLAWIVDGQDKSGMEFPTFLDWPIIGAHPLRHTSFFSSSLSPQGGILPEKMGGVYCPLPKTLTIFDQDQRYSLPFLRPNQKFETLFMTWPLNQNPAVQPWVKISSLVQRNFKLPRKHNLWRVLLITMIYVDYDIRCLDSMYLVTTLLLILLLIDLMQFSTLVYA